MKIFVDENIPSISVTALRSKGFDVQVRGPGSSPISER